MSKYNDFFILMIRRHRQSFHLKSFKHWLIRTLFLFHGGRFGPTQILTLANSDFNPIRTLANSDPISEKSLANSDLNFAGSELTSGRGPN